MNLLVTGAFNWMNEELNNLKQLGHEVVFMQQENDDLPCDPTWVEGAIGNGIFLYHTIEQFTSLRYIQLTSAGYDRIPMDYVKEHNIEIFNARGVYSIPMAEFALCGVLELYKQSLFFAENQKQHKWIKHRGVTELFGKTICIVGCGSVGTECSKKFAAFGCEVIGVDMFPYQSEYFKKMLNLQDLEVALRISDVVILTLPLTDESRGMMNIERFDIMKNGAIIVNIARGAVINTEDLISALQGKLGGAVLDVFEEEPLDKESILWDMKTVIVTPHNSFIGDGNHRRMLEVIYKNLRSRSV